MEQLLILNHPEDGSTFDNDWSLTVNNLTA